MESQRVVKRIEDINNLGGEGWVGTPCAGLAHMQSPKPNSMRIYGLTLFETYPLYSLIPMHYRLSINNVAANVLLSKSKIAFTSIVCPRLGAE